MSLEAKYINIYRECPEAIRFRLLFFKLMEVKLERLGKVHVLFEYFLAPLYFLVFSIVDLLELNCFRGLMSLVAKAMRRALNAELTVAS